MARIHLTERENDVLHLAIGGLSNDEIAARLTISRRTVEAHMRTLFRKTGVTRRAQLAALYQRGDAGPELSVPESPDAAGGLFPPLSQHRRDLANCERQLRRYADAVHGLVDRQFPLFEERVEITLMVGEQDGQDIVIERRWTKPRPYLIYRILGPIITWSDGPSYELDDLATECYVDGQDIHVDVHPVRDVGGRPLLMILFQPGLDDDTEWVLRYRSPKLWSPLRSSGQDTLSWATATLDQRHPPTINELTLKVVFAASWTGERLTEQSNLGVIHTERLPTGQTQVTWHHDTPQAGAYHWVLQGSRTS
ncbi:MAG: helix-turn-helix transcriptional regulator [Actinomycetota bacterium]|nr:helix-turn-helix transcriptional regulator [Actinomycetota bacterium]